MENSGKKIKMIKKQPYENLSFYSDVFLLN